MYWLDHGTTQKIVNRIAHTVRTVTLMLTDDTGVYQTQQTQGFPGELRNSVPRIQNFGTSTVPLPGTEGTTIATNSGYLGSAIIVGDNDPRYRPKNQKPGEHTEYMVVGADSQGNNGTLRNILSGVGQWVVTLFGKTINVGDPNVTTLNVATGPSNACTINIGETSNVTINMNGQTININGTSGDVVVNGISLVHHVHSGVQSGSSDTGPPVGS
jgi:phage baseplate assembly protein V